MRNYFVLNGADSRDYGVYLAFTDFSGAQRDDSSVSVPGRSGDLILSNGRWKNVSMKLSCWMPYGMRDRLQFFREFLQAITSYVRYEDSISPEEYRMVRFNGPFSVKSSDRVGAAFDLAFDAAPQRWLKDGELAIGYTGAGVVFNPTSFPAKPLIRCIGQSGSVTIGGRTVAVTGATEHVDIDCEAMEVYEGNTSLNGSAVLTDGEFPVLFAGVNNVSFEGFDSIKITPRWWRI